MKTSITNSILSACMASGLCAGFFGFFAPAASASVIPDIDPDVAASVWEESETECASVTLNGKEIVTYKGNLQTHAAESKAEDLADKLKDLIGDDKFDSNKLLPARDGDQIAIKVDGSIVIRFDAADTADGAKTLSPLEQSFKVVNQIRTATGAQTLPGSVLKLAEMKGDPQSLKASGNCFSGHASWYGGKFHGRKTSDGSRYDQDGLTAAHRSLPFGTKLLVMNRKTGDSCVVQVNDRGPFVGDRVIDLSRGAAKQLGMMSSGIATVDCLVLGAN